MCRPGKSVADDTQKMAKSPPRGHKGILFAKIINECEVLERGGAAFPSLESYM